MYFLLDEVKKIKLRGLFQRHLVFKTDRFVAPVLRKWKPAGFFFLRNGLVYSYRFYENGRLWAHYSVNQLDKKISQEGFDENGKPVDNFIYFREAQFKEGEQDWKEYLAKKMKAKTPVQRGAPKGSYQVIVRFMIDKEGIVTNATAETHFGYGMELEALRVISNSPKW